MKIEIYSDFSCPYCYIGERKLEKAIEEIDNNIDIEIVFKSYQLNTNAVKHEGEDINKLIAKKYGITYEDAKANNDAIINSAAEIGLNYNFDILTPNNTAMAHQVAKFAKDNGKEKVVVERLFKAYFEEGADLGELKTLLSLSKEAGLDIKNLKKALKNETFLAEVLMDQKKAHELGIQGVPYFIINEEITVSGARSIEHFKEVLNSAK